MLKQELAPRGVGIPVLQGGEEVKDGLGLNFRRKLWSF